MKPYSVYLQKSVYKNENISQIKLASRFRVALSFVTKIIQQDRQLFII